MSLDRYAPKYQQVAEMIRQWIGSGALRPGERLPSETSLAEQHGVSILTIRQAMSVLRTEGLIESRQGIGTFVREPASTPALVDLNPEDVNITLLAAVLHQIGGEVHISPEAWARACEHSYVVAHLADGSGYVVRLEDDDGRPVTDTIGSREEGSPS